MIHLVRLPLSSQPFRAVFNFPHFYIDILLGDYLFSYPSYFFSLKSGSKTDLCLCDFVCSHFCDVSKGCETQKKNKFVSRHFKLDLESKLKSHGQGLLLLFCLGVGPFQYYTVSVGNRIFSRSWPTASKCPRADKTIKISAKRRRFHYVLRSFRLSHFFVYLFLSLYHQFTNVTVQMSPTD